MKRYCVNCDEIIETDDSLFRCPECGDETEHVSICDHCGKEFYDIKLDSLCPDCFAKAITAENVSKYSNEDRYDKEILDFTSNCPPFLLFAFRSDMERVLTRAFEALDENEQIELMQDYINGNEEDFAAFVSYTERTKQNDI